MVLGSAKQIAYVPILKWKRGEQLALSALPPSARRRILPLAEIQNRPFDWQSEEYTRTWRQHLEAVVQATRKYWGTEQEIAFDQPLEGSESEDGSDDFDGVAPWRYLFEMLWDADVNAVPVVSSYALREELSSLATLPFRQRRRRFVLRAHFDDEEQDGQPVDVGAWFRKTMKMLQASHSDVDAVFDLGYFAGDVEEGAMAEYCATTLREIALQGPWRTLTLASGAFPVNLASYKTGAHKIPRYDWELYREVAEQMSQRVLYSDYGVNYTDAFEMDPRTIRMSANLRYTHLKYWRVYKARNVKEHGFDQYRNLCELLVNSPEYLGREFSEGDKNIHKVATDPKAGPGSATTWRRDATNHHIHVVLSQLRERG